MLMLRRLIIAVPTVFSFAVPGAIAAEDRPGENSSDNTTEQTSQCMDGCVDACAARCSGKEASIPMKMRKAAKRGTRSTAANAPVITSTPDDSSRMTRTSTAPSEDRTVIREEERARAAEEMRTSEETLVKSHEAQLAELAKTREAERTAAAEAERQHVERVRAEENASYRALDRNDAEFADRDEVIKSALLTPVGLYGFVGGGATDFTQPSATGAAQVGGYWDARLGIGSRSILGGEVAYVGGVRDVKALGLNNSAFLMNNGVEGVARLNVPITPEYVLFEPYTFGGIGWQHYTLEGETTNTSSIANADDVMTVPFGVGMAFGIAGATLDVRGTYRPAVFSDLLGNSTSSFDSSALSSWGAGAALGFEF